MDGFWIFYSATFTVFFFDYLFTSTVLINELRPSFTNLNNELRSQAVLWAPQPGVFFLFFVVVVVVWWVVNCLNSGALISLVSPLMIHEYSGTTCLQSNALNREQYPTRDLYSCSLTILQGCQKVHHHLSWTGFNGLPFRTLLSSEENTFFMSTYKLNLVYSEEPDHCPT